MFHSYMFLFSRGLVYSLQYIWRTEIDFGVLTHSQGNFFFFVWGGPENMKWKSRSTNCLDLDRRYPFQLVRVHFCSALKNGQFFSESEVLRWSYEPSNNNLGPLNHQVFPKISGKPCPSQKDLLQDSIVWVKCQQNLGLWGLVVLKGLEGCSSLCLVMIPPGPRMNSWQPWRFSSGSLSLRR